MQKNILSTCGIFVSPFAGGWIEIIGEWTTDCGKWQKIFEDLKKLEVAVKEAEERVEAEKKAREEWEKAKSKLQEFEDKAKKMAEKAETVYISAPGVVGGEVPKLQSSLASVKQAINAIKSSDAPFLEHAKAADIKKNAEQALNEKMTTLQVPVKDFFGNAKKVFDNKVKELEGRNERIRSTTIKNIITIKTLSKVEISYLIRIILSVFVERFDVYFDIDSSNAVPGDGSDADEVSELKNKVAELTQLFEEVEGAKKRLRQDQMPVIKIKTPAEGGS